MSHCLRRRVPTALVFFAVTLADRQSQSLVDQLEALRAAFRAARAERPFRIDARVLLPDHLHTAWTLPENDADCSIR
jgi:putative transposase